MKDIHICSLKYKNRSQVKMFAGYVKDARIASHVRVRANLASQKLLWLKQASEKFAAVGTNLNHHQMT